MYGKNMIFKLAAIIFVLIKTTKCSLVVDSSSQNGIYVTEYCPKMPHCTEGTHVMCMYYNTRSIMGPKCVNAQNVSITPDIATKLLDITNAVRSKIALGKEKGKGGEYLPRGYGIFRLIWDNELATFAQVLANQCILRHDLCRASKKFPDPGQTAGLVRFSYPDWFPVSKSGHFTTPGLSDSKLTYAATQILKSWYNQKTSVTPDLVVSYPDWNLNPNDLGGRLYLEMIHGSATHIGCGISAYTEFAYYDNNAALNYNSVQIICNFSTRPHKGSSVYNITQPSAPGYTVRCGCPPGSDEDDDCLCRENPNITHDCVYLSKCRPLAFTEETPAMVCSDKDVDCKDPTVVLLPIFTIEDAPQSKLIKPPEYINRSLRMGDDNMEILKKIKSPVENQHQKSNIFTKLKQFHLPISNNKFHAVVSSMEHSSKENDRLAVHESLTKQIYSTNDNHNIVSDLHDTKKTDNLSTVRKSNLNTAEGKIMTHEHYWNTNTIKTDAKSANLDGIDKKANKLLHLLDKLEKEMKNIDLTDNEKVLIDAKIMKIYGSVIGHENLLSHFVPKINHRSQAESQTDHDNIDTDYYLDDDYKRQPNYNTNFKHLDRSPRHDVNNMSKKEAFKDCAKRNHRLNCKIDNYKNTGYKDRTYDNNFDMNHNNLRDNFEEFGVENDRGINRDHFYEDKSRDHRKINTFNKNHYRDDNERYNYRESGEETDMKRYRQFHYFEDDIKPRNIYKPANLRSSYRNNIRKTYIRRDKYRNTYLSDDDPLGPERRNYYNDKLDRLQRRVQERQNYAQSKRRGGRAMRPMRPTDSFNTRSKSLDAPYMPDRARFLHGF